MKLSVVVLLICLTAGGVQAGSDAQKQVFVKTVQGEVLVRHGVTEAWTLVREGQVLRADDTFKTGHQSSAVIVASGTSHGKKTISIPSEVIVDISDVRELSQEDLILKLTMEKVRSSSYQWKNNEMNIPNATVVHGSDRTANDAESNSVEMGRFQMNGTRVLFTNGYYSTCALRTMDIFRRYPALGAEFENRLLLAEALEKASLRGEALNEYVLMVRDEALSSLQATLVRGRISALRKQFGE